MVSTVVPLALYLGAPPALEVPEALALERLPAPCSIGSCSGTLGSYKGLMVPKGAPLALGAPRALVTDEAFWDHETYICMIHLGVLGLVCTLGASASFKGPDGHQRIPLILALGAPLVLGPQLASKSPHCHQMIPLTLSLGAHLF